MNRDFEEAYKELAVMEAPDLWDRIEENLSDRTAPKEKPSIYVFLKRYSAVAAALLCAVILVPVLMLTLGRRGKFSAGNTAAADTVEMAAADMKEDYGSQAPAAGFEEAECEVAAEAAFDEWDEAAAFEDTEEEAAFEAAGEAAVTEDLAEAVQGSEDGSQADSASKNANVVRTEAAKEKEEKNNIVFENVTIWVKEVKALEEGKPEEIGTLYTATVQEPSSSLKEGDTIYIFNPVYSSFKLTKGEQVKLNLELMEDASIGDGKNVYLLVGYSPN